MEKKFYLIAPESHADTARIKSLSNEDFIKESYKQDLVFTPEEFINSFNNFGTVEQDSQILRIL